MNKKKILVAAAEGINTNMLISELLLMGVALTVIIEERIPLKNKLKTRIKMVGILKTFGQLLFLCTIYKFLEILSKNKVIEAHLDRTSFIRIASINSDEFIDHIYKFSPDLIVINGVRIINKKTLSKINIPIVNIHTGITPEFRGIHGAYWALYKNRRDLAGVTLHYVDKGVDTGNVIAQSAIDIKRTDNFYTYPIKQYAEGIQLLKRFITGQNSDESSSIISKNEFSAQWYHPTFFEYVGAYLFRGIK